MKILLNILWFIFGGAIAAILWALAGLVLCITIIGIPFGMQCFKIAGFVLFPFGKDIKIGEFGAYSLIGNILWAIFLGWELFLSHITSGLVLCLTIIGIPFGIQHFKFALLSFIPFGAEITETE
jgi:uncharacterized membrane protein YccF (DUF307 family)